VPLWAWTGYAGLLAGFALLMTAPGNFERDAAVLASQNMAEVPLFKRLLFGFAKVTYRYLTEGVAVTAVLAVMYALYKRLPNRPIETRYLAVFPAAALLGLLAMSATVIFPQRAWFGIISFAIVAIAILYSRISVERQLPVRKINRLALLCLLAVAVSQYCVALGDMWQVSKTYSGYEAAVCEQRQSGKDIIALPASDYEFRSEFVNPFLSADTAHYANKTFSLYHGVKSVAVEK
jgi:multisubunit Na+/H+ antiporter MnhB subunit